MVVFLAMLTPSLPRVVRTQGSFKLKVVQQRNVGSGTGMICHESKGGIGTVSRFLNSKNEQYTTGVLVQANYGRRRDLTIAGIPLGRELEGIAPMPLQAGGSEGSGSIIVVVGTDAPLLPHQLKRLARRVPLGTARVGGLGANYSGDIFVAFSTANPPAALAKATDSARSHPDATATANAASTTSPAPVTSYTSRARVRISLPCLPFCCK